MKLRTMLLALGLTAAGFQAHAADMPKVEVLHWWTSGGEAAALNLLKQKLQAEGIQWQDIPVAGGGGTAAMTVLRARIAAGNPPTASQMLGYDILDWAQQGNVANLNSVADAGGWAKAVPKAVQNFSMYKGVWIAAPVDIHSTNWIWVNKAIFDKLHLSQPTNWDEFVTMLDKMKAAGVTPIAHGGQAWQEATIFDSVVLSTGGADFYKKALIDLDSSALGSTTMKTVFDRMSKLRSYVDPNFSGRDWNLATAMVARGDAGLQIMGDWAQGEFHNAGKKAGADYLCFRFPGTQGAVTFNSDQFVMFKVGANRQAAQYAFAKAVMDPGFQSQFNIIKGAAPARLDVSDAGFNACGKKAIADVREASDKGTLLGSFAHGHANSASVKQAIYDVVTKEFNGQLTSSQAPAELVAAVQNAQ